MIVVDVLSSSVIRVFVLLVTVDFDELVEDEVTLLPPPLRCPNEVRLGRAPRESPSLPPPSDNAPFAPPPSECTNSTFTSFDFDLDFDLDFGFGCARSDCTPPACGAKSKFTGSVCVESDCDV